MRPIAAGLLFISSACAPDLDGELQQAGRFEELQAFEAAGEGFAAALADPVAGVGTLTLVRLADSTACSADRVDTFFPRHGPAGALVLVAWSADSGIGFYDAACRPLHDPIVSARPTAVHEAIFGGDYRHHLVITTEDQRFLLVQPFSGDVVDLSDEPVRGFRWVGLSQTWLFRGAHLILSGLDGTVTRQLGEAVSEVAWTAAGAAAYVDGGDLWLVASAEAEPEPLAQDVCEVHALAGREALAYLSPCASRTLVVHDLNGAPLTVADDVAAFRPEISPIFFADHAGAVGAIINGQPVPVADSASLPSVRRIPGGAHLLLAGQSGHADLLRFEGATTHLRSNVARFAVRHDRMAMLTDVSGETGALWLGEQGEGEELIATGVRPEGFDFGDQLEAFGFISGAESGAGRLEVIVLATGDRITVAEGVSEVAELRSDATPGLAYVIAHGPNAGIWFASAP